MTIILQPQSQLPALVHTDAPEVSVDRQVTHAPIFDVGARFAIWNGRNTAREYGLGKKQEYAGEGPVCVMCVWMCV